MGLFDEVVGAFLKGDAGKYHISANLRVVVLRLI